MKKGFGKACCTNAKETKVRTQTDEIQRYGNREKATNIRK